MYLADRRDTITNPTVLVEVLSPSTGLTDRNDKLADVYRKVDWNRSAD